MTNVLIPSMGKSLFFKDSYFPKQMIEVGGKTILEHVVENFKTLDDYHFIFVFEHKDCAEFHLDESVKILTDNDADVLVLENQTAGALCTSLMATPWINNSEQLIIANCDQILDVNYQEVIKTFEEKSCGAGAITFDSVHPRWSYVKIDDEDNVVEVAEKRPLSKHAIAGFYYFDQGKKFIEAAERVILKDNNINGMYYISSSLNEMILKGEKVGYFEISRDKYHSFYSPEKLKEYEGRIKHYAC